METLQDIAQLDDPIERIRRLGDAITGYQGLLEEAARLRRAAIDQARANGMTQQQIAAAAGVSPGRISQMSKLRPPGIVTGWFLPPSQATLQHIAICGSRAQGANTEAIDQTIRALGGFLTRCRCRVTHGPVGVGIEVMTHIADHYRPPGLGAVAGIVGRPNVVRDAEYVLVVGGDQGTQVEVELATSMGRKLLPMPTSGGTAARTYALLQREAHLRAWMADTDFATLEHADADGYTRVLEKVLSATANDAGVSHA